MLSHFVPNSSRGFLPIDEPLVCLPEATSTRMLNFEINHIFENIPTLIRNKELRAKVDALNRTYHSNPLVSLNRMDPREVNVAATVFAAITQAYIWQDLADPASTVPHLIAKNIWELERYRSKVPVMTYDHYVLQNWRLVDKSKPISLENVEPIFTFTDSSNEAWFIKVHVVIEAAFAPALVAGNDLAKWAASSEVFSPDRLAKRFSIMQQSIQSAAAIIAKMYHGCDREFFCDILRPYLDGTEKVGKIKFDLPEEESCNELSKLYRGSSGAQSSSLPALDGVLNIQHIDNGMSRLLAAFIDYMPKPHADFIKRMQGSDIAGLLRRSQCLNLPEYAAAIDALAEFRNKHVKMTQYYLPAKNIGTGGTDFNLFLKSRMQTTIEAAETKRPKAKL